MGRGGEASEGLCRVSEGFSSWGFGTRAHSNSAKYKKFSTRAEAESFVGSGPSTAPYSQRGRPSTSATPGTQNGFRPVVTDKEQPLTLADPASLPPALAQIAKQGFSFTTAPHRLIVYTDGSSLDNGKSTARAGLGVFWGSTGLAATRNIAEKVPGDVQTNNRGELLVSQST